MYDNDMKVSFDPARRAGALAERGLDFVDLGLVFFGLTDAVLLDLAAQKSMILAADLDRHPAALSAGYQATNFNHLRDLRVGVVSPRLSAPSREGPMTTPTVRIAILGASGYTGAELLRLLLCHPAADVRVLTAERQAGKPMAEIFPHLGPFGLPDTVKIAEVDWDGVDFVFCALPHGTTQEVIAGLPERLRVVDLSADFRLRDTEVYAEWYGHPHKAPALQGQAVYGLTEHARPAVRAARLVANPGCYPTASMIPLIPLLKAGQIDPGSLIIDAKSGVSGAGRDAKQGNLFCEISEGMSAYGIGRHRHMPEMEQELALAACGPVSLSFTPHLIPMTRGELITTYVRLVGGATVESLRETLAAAYKDEPFLKLLPVGAAPNTHTVRGSNHLHMTVFPDHRPGHAIVLSVLDNLVKGASGQAIQNMNVMLGLPETMGLQQVALMP